MIDIKTDSSDKGFTLSAKGPGSEIAEQAVAIGLAMANLFAECSHSDFGTFIQMLLANKDQMKKIQKPENVFLFNDHKDDDDDEMHDTESDFKGFMGAMMSKIMKEKLADDIKNSDDLKTDDPLTEAFKKMLIADLEGNRKAKEDAENELSCHLMNGILGLDEEGE